MTMKRITPQFLKNQEKPNEDGWVEVDPKVFCYKPEDVRRVFVRYGVKPLPVSDSPLTPCKLCKTKPVKEKRVKDFGQCNALNSHGRRCPRQAVMKTHYFGDPEMYTHRGSFPTWVRVEFCENHLPRT